MATETGKVAEAGTVKKKTTTHPQTVTEKSVVDIVSEKVSEFLKSGQLDLPKNYSVDNAMKSAYLLLNTVQDKNKNPVMVDGKLTGVCTKASIANAVLDMVIQGLNPAKKQCYFIVYGKALACHRSYFGSMAVAQWVNPAIKDWGYNVVYESDVFKYGILNGKASVVEHRQELDNIDKANIRAAYAMALGADGNPIKTEIMTIEEIHQAWRMSNTSPFNADGVLKGDSTHGKFARDMALRTVINKVAKFIINASSDNALLLERINRSEELADAAAAQAEIEEKANTGSVIMISEEPPRLGSAEEPKADSPASPPAEAAVVEEKSVARGPELGRGPAF